MYDTAISVDELERVRKDSRERINNQCVLLLTVFVNDKIIYSDSLEIEIAKDEMVDELMCETPDYLNVIEIVNNKFINHGWVVEFDEFREMYVYEAK